MATKNFKTRDSVVWTPSSDTIGTILNKAGTGNPLSVAEHDDTHKYLYKKSAIEYLNDTTIATLADGNLFIYDSVTSKWFNRVMSGDAVIDKTGAITVSKIGAKAVSLGGSFTTSGAFATTITVTAATNVTLPTTGTLLNDSLTSGYMYMGSAGNAATGYSIDATGDVTASIVGGKIKYVIASGVITDSNVSAAAAISGTKIAVGANSKIAITTAGGALTYADTATYPSLTELSYVKGVTSAIQTQFTTITGTTIPNILSGTTSFTNINIDNININGNTISSTSGHIILTPNGASEVQIDTGVCTTNFDLDGYDLILDTDGDTFIHCSADDVIQFCVWDGAASTGQVNVIDGVIQPVTTNDIDLGDTTHNFKNLYIRTITSGGNNMTISCANLNSITLTAGDGGDIQLGQLTDEIVIGSATGLAGFFGTAASAQSTGWTVTNFVSAKALDANTAVLGEVADVLGTLLNELFAKGFLDGTATP